MKSLQFSEFDAFADTVRDVDAVMTMQNPERRVWTINQTALKGLHIQLGQVGSGNIVEGQSWSDGTLLYLPLSAGVTYRANGVATHMIGALFSCRKGTPLKTSGHTMSRGAQLASSRDGFAIPCVRS